MALAGRGSAIAGVGALQFGCQVCVSELSYERERKRAATLDAIDWNLRSILVW